MTNSQIAKLIVQTNNLLKKGYCPIKGATIGEAKAYRYGLCTTLEAVLHAANAYAGYGYVDLPFIEGVTDESKRVYYMKAKIAKVAEKVAHV